VLEKQSLKVVGRTKVAQCSNDGFLWRSNGT